MGNINQQYLYCQIVLAALVFFFKFVDAYKSIVCIICSHVLLTHIKAMFVLSVVTFWSNGEINFATLLLRAQKWCADDHNHLIALVFAF